MKHTLIGSALALCISSLGIWALWPDSDESAATSPSAEIVAEPKGARVRNDSPEPVTVASTQETDPQPVPHFAGTRAESDDGAASAAQLTGEVVGPDGLPIAGASVRAEIYAPELSHGSGERVGTLEQQTNEEGHFAFELSLGQEASLTVEAEGYAPHVSVSHPAGERCLVRLDHPATLAVEIVDDEGRPVSGARVSARPPHRDPRWAAQVVLCEATTDEHGQAGLEGLPAGVCHVEVVPDRHQSFEQVVELTPGATTTQRWVVQLGTSFTGEVKDERTGLPLVGAHVRCKNEFFSPRWDREDHTDELGRFRIEGVSKGSPFFQVDYPGYVSAGGHLHMKTDGRFSEVVDMTPGRRVTGRFVDPEGQPVPDVSFVIATYEDDFDHRSGRSDSAGRFEVDGLSPTLAYSLQPSSTAWAATCVPVGDHEDQGDIALTRGGRIEGRLVDPSGQPFAGANLRDALMLPGTESGRYEPGESTRQMLSERSIITDREGRFSFGSLAPGHHRLYFNDRSFVGFPHLDLELEAGEIRREVEMIVERPATICGRVLDANGQAAAWATLIAGEPGERVRRCRTITETDGSFELPVAPGKVYDIQILPMDTGDAPSSGAATLALAIRAGTRDLEIALPTSRRIQGVVQSPTGAPQANVMIMARDALENRITAESSDEAGRFALDLPDGTAVTMTFTARKERREGDRVLWVQDTSRTHALTLHMTRDDSITVEVPWE